ncbi:MAG: hypothetical protein AAF633_20910, partial [Chloroflexota bacterium]
KPYWFDGWVGGKPGKNYAVGFGAVTPYYEEKSAEGEVTKRFLDAGENPPDGVVMTYHIKETPKPEDEVALIISTPDGGEVTRFTPLPNKNKDEKEDGNGERKVEKGKRYLSVKPGMNRFVWNMRWADGVKVDGEDPIAIRPRGPRVPPGDYQLTLKVNGHQESTSFKIVRDPRIDASQADLDAQFGLLRSIQEKLSETNQAINTVRSLKGQVKKWKDLLKDHPQVAEIKAAGDQLTAKLSEVEEALTPTGATTEWESFNYQARLASRLASLSPVVGSSDHRPTSQSFEVFEKLSGEIDEVLQKLAGIVAEDVAAFNRLLAGYQVPSLVSG